MVNIDPKLLDQIGQLEVYALLDGLNDPEMRRNPAFLEKVRKFLNQNKLDIGSETPGLQELKYKATEAIPDFPMEVTYH